MLRKNVDRAHFDYSTAREIRLRLPSAGWVERILLHAQLPPQLARRLDVRDFGTPIGTIETTSVGGHARMRVELAGAGEIAVYQVDRQIIVSPH